MKRICLNIGDIVATREPALLETILGSCVAVCLWDPRQRIGGLNHYLVPSGRGEPERANLYGMTSIRRLIDQVLALGADRSRLQARIFGGGSILKSLEDIFTIGAANVRIARELLARDGIPVVHDFVGAECGIRIAFRTDSGSVRVTCFDQESGRRYEDYCQQAETGAQPLLCSSTHTTGFFREAQRTEFLEQTVFPALAMHKRPSGELRIWSAGCTTGETAYTLAISLAETLQRYPRDTGGPFGGWRVRILATDPSRKALATAAAAVYGVEQLPPHLPEPLRARYFLKGSGAAAGHIRVKPLLQEAIRFRRLQLLLPDYPFQRPFDLICCHDGLRACDNATGQLVLRRLRHHLAPQGCLQLDTPGLTPDSDLFEQIDDRIFRRR